MSEDYSYIQPEDLFVNDDGLMEAVPQPVVLQVNPNEEWIIQKKANRQWNLANANNCWYKGEFRRNP